MANEAWMDLFVNAEAAFLNEGIFDHSPAVIVCKPKKDEGKKVFRYFRMWKSHPQYGDIIKRVWQENIHGTKMYQLLNHQKKLKVEFSKLNRSEFANIQERAGEASQQLEDIQNKLRSSPLHNCLIEEEFKSREKYNRLQKAYISFLQQKAKFDWGKEGDTNSGLYHSSIKLRQRRSRIRSVVNDANERIFEEDGIRNVFVEHYQKFFAASMQKRMSVRTSIVKKGKCLTEQ